MITSSGNTTHTSLRAEAAPVFRTPLPEDAPAAYRLVRQYAGDGGRPHHYRLWFRDFGDCCLVATLGAALVGILLGYRPPTAPSTYCVSRIVIDPLIGDPHFSARFLQAAVDRQHAYGAECVEVVASSRLDLAKVKDYAGTASSTTWASIRPLTGSQREEVLHCIIPVVATG